MKKTIFSLVCISSMACNGSNHDAILGLWKLQNLTTSNQSDSLNFASLAQDLRQGKIKITDHAIIFLSKNDDVIDSTKYLVRGGKEMLFINGNDTTTGTWTGDDKSLNLNFGTTNYVLTRLP